MLHNRAMDARHSTHGHRHLPTSVCVTQAKTTTAVCVWLYQNRCAMIEGPHSIPNVQTGEARRKAANIICENIYSGMSNFSV